jgi:phospholipid/cholesterol/gamma-HCH transport system substrate-binding protein
MQESLLGLFIIVALGLFGLLLLWVRNFRFGAGSYTATVEFQNASGMQVGTPVSYRGVKVGQVTAVTAQPRGVSLRVEISPADLLIPKKSLVEARQAGLIGETSIDFSPQQDLPAEIPGKPLDQNCDSSLIICNGDRLIGQEKLDVDALIRSLLKISNAIGTPEFANNINRLTKNAADAASGVAQLTREVVTPIKSIGKTADEFQALAGELKREIPGPLQSVQLAADEFRMTARQLNEFQAANRTTLASTLRNVEATSNEIRLAITALRPVVNEVSRGEFIRNLDALTSNAAAAAANLRTASQEFTNPQTFLLLQQTLDSARMTFQNAQKITTDLDELLGDPNFREQIRKLIEGLSQLVSSTQQLEQQTEIAQTIAPLSTQLQQITQNQTPKHQSADTQPAK